VELKVFADFKSVYRRLEKLSAKGMPQAQLSAHHIIGMLVKRTAVKNAPISPTQQVLNRLRKTTGKTRRKASATSRTKPGGLQRSIEMESDQNDAAIYVASNSEAGKYASYIHDKKNVQGGWFKRGLGTVAKGPQADEKFITRAIEEHSTNGDIKKIIEDQIDRALRG